MNASKIKEGFPSGDVHYSFGSNQILVFFWRLLYVAVGVWAIYHIMHAEVLMDKVVGYLFLALSFWKFQQQGGSLFYICDRGIVVRRRTMNPAEALQSMWNDDSFYIFITYDNIVGFTERWEMMHVGSPSEGNVFVVPVDLMFLNVKDKRFIIEYIEKQQMNLV